jgi:hypothetical protein
MPGEKYIEGRRLFGSSLFTTSFVACNGCWERTVHGRIKLQRKTRSTFRGCVTGGGSGLFPCR